MFGVVAFASIVTISIYRYGRYRIDLTIFRRRHGEIIAQQESNNQDNLTKNDDGNDSKDDTTQLPTANLIDHVDKE
jgi:hypothetical protein